MKKYCMKCGIEFDAEPKQKYCSKKCRSNDHAARTHYYPKFGSAAKTKYLLKRIERKIDHGYVNEKFENYEKLKATRREYQKNVRSKKKRENAELSKLKTINFINQFQRIKNGNNGNGNSGNNSNA